MPSITLADKELFYDVVLGNKTDAIIFKIATGENIDCVTLTAGSGIYTIMGRSSLGFRAMTYINGVRKTGFIAAAHGINNLDSVYDETPSSSTKTHIGTGTSKWQYGGSVDAVFVEQTNSTGITNRLGNENIFLNGNYITLAQGAACAKYGDTTKYTTGTVEYASTGGTVNLVTFSDLVCTSALTSPGDSGGPAIALPVSASGYASLVGIVKGSNTSNGYSFIVKASNINAAFGITLY